ncbi:MAG TPA: ATP-binding cassette domain-containing protein [Rhodocyclaceae bacterium]
MIAAQSLTKRYPGSRANSVDGISLAIAAGEFIAVSGRSGAGKTTLLKLLGAIEKPTGGSLVVNGQNLAALTPAALPFVRRNIGFVFQDQKLLYDRSALDNARLPLDIVGMAPREAQRRAQAALDKVGLAGRERTLPLALSGGEQQRLAIARAVVNRPALLIADEPIASLDDETAADVMRVFKAFHEVGTTVIVASHDDAWAKRLAARPLHLAAGRVA